MVNNNRILIEEKTNPSNIWQLPDDLEHICPIKKYDYTLTKKEIEIFKNHETYKNTFCCYCCFSQHIE